MLEITVFLCGAVVMVIELTGSRVLAPYLGTSLVVWTSLIGIILASPDEPLPADPDPDMVAMLAKRLDIPAAAGVQILTDDYAPVDRYIMSAW